MFGTLRSSSAYTNAASPSPAPAPESPARILATHSSITCAGTAIPISRPAIMVLMPIRRTGGPSPPRSSPFRRPGLQAGRNDSSSPGTCPTTVRPGCWSSTDARPARDRRSRETTRTGSSVIFNCLASRDRFGPVERRANRRHERKQCSSIIDRACSITLRRKKKGRPSSEGRPFGLRYCWV